MPLTNTQLRYIAATAAANAMMVATRDVAPFEAVGLKTVKP
ncbi:MAG: hypothetical protein OXI73_06955 [Rhodospirillales bacterium]|nr:hypothetical protein [Rhodospirillales bacterium]